MPMSISLIVLRELSKRDLSVKLLGPRSLHLRHHQSSSWPASRRALEVCRIPASPSFPTSPSPAPTKLVPETSFSGPRNPRGGISLSMASPSREVFCTFALGCMCDKSRVSLVLTFICAVGGQNLISIPASCYSRCWFQNMVGHSESTLPGCITTLGRSTSYCLYITLLRVVTFRKTCGIMTVL